MSVFISSSLYPNSTIDFAISKIISNFGNNVEISAPHQFQHIDLLKNIFLKYKDQNINFILHNYFPRPKKDFVLKGDTIKDSVDQNDRIISWIENVILFLQG